MAGAGGIFRDETGRWLGRFMQCIGISTSVVAKLWAVKKGLEIAWDMRVRQLVLKVDSEIIIAKTVYTKAG